MFPQSATDVLQAVVRILDGRSAVTIYTDSLGKTTIRVER